MGFCHLSNKLKTQFFGIDIFDSREHFCIDFTKKKSIWMFASVDNFRKFIRECYSIKKIYNSVTVIIAFCVYIKKNFKTILKLTGHYKLTIQLFYILNRPVSVE